MNYEPAMEGHEGRTPPPDAAAPQWPVLARLPYVGADGIGDVPRPWNRPDGRHSPHGAASGPSTPVPRAADQASAYEPRSYERVDYLEYSTNRPGANRENGAVPPASDAYPDRGRQRYRIDAAQPRGGAAPAPVRLASPPTESQTLAARVFHWHAALAPYAGLATTFVLAMFAGLLYWSMFAGRESPSNPLSAPPQWTVDSNAVPSVDENRSFAPRAPYDSPEWPLSRTPRIQLNIPTIGELNTDLASVEEVAATPLIDAEPGASDIVNGAEAVEPAPEAVGEDPKLTAQGETGLPIPDASTSAPPAPLTISYPTTPFAPFDFGPTAHQAAAPAEAAAPATTR